MYDAIIVGARVAGAPLALLLARRGHRVLLLDRATFPSDTLSTHFILPEGSARLRSWGLLDPLLDAGCRPITTLTRDFGLITLAGPIGGDAPGLCPRRYVLDTLLVEAARAARAEFRGGFTAHDLLRDGEGRVVGLRGRDDAGATVEEHARLVVGADGYHSFVAKAVGAQEYDVRPGTSCGYYSYWSGIAGDGAEVHWRDNRILFAFPTNEGRTCIAQEVPATMFGSFRADIERTFDAGLDAVPDLAARVRAGRREERFAGLAPRPALFRQAWGPGWALAGDAGCYKDPVSGSGITDAFRDADLLADALDAGLSGRQPLDEALAAYGAARDAATRPGYEGAALLSSFAPLTPDLLQKIAGATGGPPQPAAAPA
jgi:flavin-dependent dehydrogenase